MSIDVIDEIVNLSNTLPLWQRDALRRIVTRDVLTEEDYSELLNMLLASHGHVDETDPPIKPIPVERKHFGVPTRGGPKVILKSMYDLQNINALAPRQKIEFGTDGVTVIYGENASGKSGYSRVLKNVCRSRDIEERLLPDVFDEDADSDFQEANFELQVNGTEKTIKWISGQEPPDFLKELAVFDSNCARLYINAEAEIQFLPYKLDSLTELAKCFDVIRDMLDKIRPKVEEIPDDLKNVDQETEVARILRDLDKAPPEQVARLSELSDNELHRLEELEEIFSKDDPIKEAATLRRKSSRIGKLVDSIEKVQVDLSDESLIKYKILYEETTAAGKSAKLAAERLSECQPLEGVGTDPWKTFFYAAEKYSREVAYKNRDFPVTDEDSRCVLCQQILDEHSKIRLNNFFRFVKEDIQKKADAKRLELKGVDFRLQNLDVKTLADDTELLAEIEELDLKLKKAVETCIPTLITRRDTMLEWLRQKGEFESISNLKDIPIEELKGLCRGLVRKAVDYEDTKKSDERKKMEFEQKSLVARAKLKVYLKDINKIMKSIEFNQLIDKCESYTKTGVITSAQKEIANHASTQNLVTVLEEELRELHAQNIPLTVKIRGKKGKTLYRLVPDGVSHEIDLSSVLSEGEHCAVALSSFLAELKAGGFECGIVLDDPVSSLDHKRRELVARRLIHEGRKRQVIIFTHDIVFLMRLNKKAAEYRVPIIVQSVNRFGGEIGMVSEDVPIKAKTVGQKQQELQSLIKKANEEFAQKNVAEYERLVGRYYSRLRATWEKIIEEKIFNKCIGRYDVEVKTRNLDKVVFTDDLFLQFTNCYDKCCRITDAHDHPEADKPDNPEVNEMKDDLKEMESFLTTLKVLQEKAKDSREKRSTPPK